VDSVIERHVSHRLQDDFLILSPDETSNRDLVQHFLNDPRLEGVLTGSSLVSVSQWVSQAAREIEPRRMAAPEWVHEALFRPRAEKIFQNASPGSALNQRLSIASLYQLITAFREERLGAAELRSFVAAFDPELAESCAELFHDYGQTLKSHPHTWDFTAEADRVLQGIERGEIAALKRLRTLYWLGFTHPSPLLKALIGAIEKYLPSLEQILIVQIPQRWTPKTGSRPSGDPKGVYLTASPPLLRTSLLCFPGPFDEAAYLLDEIARQVNEGIDPDRIGLFLPPDLFWEAYFSQELTKRGLLSRSLQRRPLGSFSKIAATCLETPAKALELTAAALEVLHQNFKEKNSEALALEIRALHQWHEELERVVFLRARSRNFAKARSLFPVSPPGSCWQRPPPRPSGLKAPQGHRP
jgi:hypothetical protein